MRLVLQCAMCGTHHPVGTPACSTCRASGVTQLRLMFECPACGSLGLNPTCDVCPPVVPLSLDDDLIVAEEVPDESFTLDPPIAEDIEEIDLRLDFDDDEAVFTLDDADEDEAVIVDEKEDDRDDADESDD